ncbi:pimeloyl-ACP methyl ester carboxylesterase [Kibdelosporangium banguiense]|uniref:Pimeloyl-ACP methyl ester carboxylesterase n=1 Tax=Kibdelosporangium banguiense TaxID=1365924 RepID=A0ABS4T7K7_9PSEU|nr:alpha/beta hydrolase [Kibdelosporangium banguiense]MBP2320412.1 pimeloyl-ACP methyl ester carboxylesterase [Kibdelosporangium banguiense]
MRARIERSPRAPHLRDVLDIPDCGDWIQQERPTEVNAALLSFLQTLPTA